ncbi:MAG: DUF92 domain-containing protein [Gemmatimonas sp.]|nr:DUF92 domain-containing protein [Gemmatimonas sp.]
MAMLARRVGSLSTSGAVAATMVGAVSATAGWPWAALLIGWFVASSVLTRIGSTLKAQRTRATLPAASARTGTQVWANGGVFAVCALAATLTERDAFRIAALGALAAAAADTWATEVGLLAGRAPRLILGGAAVEPGLSGGVTWPGSAGGVLGAVAVALAAIGLGLATSTSWLALAGAGVVGGVGDSLLGATVQAKRRCARCQRWTERATHDCGVATEHGRGWPWMTNDTVNLLATFIGAAAAILLSIP